MPKLHKLTRECDRSILTDDHRVELEPAQTYGRDPVRLVPASTNSAFEAGPDVLNFPAVAFQTYTDASVRGRSNLITTHDQIILHDLYDRRTDALPEVFYSVLLAHADGPVVAWRPEVHQWHGDLPLAAMFTDALSYNYAHWMTETLPRISRFLDLEAASGIPLILDAFAHPNMRRSLALLGADMANVIEVAPRSMLKVGSLVTISPTAYVPFKRLAVDGADHSHGLFSRTDMRRTAARLARSRDGGRAVSAVAANTGPTRLFLRRRSDLRNLINEEEIASALGVMGFVPVDTAIMDLDQQIDLFSRAEIIVAATGSALANMIFCPEGAAVVALIPDFRHTAYWYWRNLASAVGVRMFHVAGGQVGPPCDDVHDPRAVHADFAVSVRDVLDSVEAAISG